MLTSSVLFENSDSTNEAVLQFFSEDQWASLMVDTILMIAKCWLPGGTAQLRRPSLLLSFPAKDIKLRRGMWTFPTLMEDNYWYDIRHGSRFQGASSVLSLAANIFVTYLASSVWKRAHSLPRSGEAKASLVPDPFPASSSGSKWEQTPRSSPTIKNMVRSRGPCWRPQARGVYNWVYLVGMSTLFERNAPLDGCMHAMRPRTVLRCYMSEPVST